MWVEHLHPRDEYGRFKLSGASGYWDRMLGSEANRTHAAHIAEIEASWQRQFTYFQPLQAAGKLTPEQDAEWDRDIERREALQKLLPMAYNRRLRPMDNGTWRFPKTDENRGKWQDVFDSEGNRVPHMALQGATLVGDRPDGRPGGVWHRPGEYGPGHVPVLRNEFGARMTQLDPEESRSRKNRQVRGALSRAESRAEAAQSHWHLSRTDEESRGASAEIHGGYMLSPLNPVGRPRTARKKHQRKTSTDVWIRRLNAQMEGR